jgi:hypothetical protein
MNADFIDLQITQITFSSYVIVREAKVSRRNVLVHSVV